MDIGTGHERREKHDGINSSCGSTELTEVRDAEGARGEAAARI
jgi:hypothetical protein